MINVMFDNGYQLSLPGYKVRKFDGEKTSHIDITGPDGEFYHINYNKILFIETSEDKEERPKESYQEFIARRSKR